MKILFRFLLFIFLFLFILINHVRAGPVNNVEKREKLEIWGKNLGANETAKSSTSKKIIMIDVSKDKASLIRLSRGIDKEERVFKNLKEAQDYLRSLLKKREEFEKDFYGVNITAYRYVNIFDCLGYIRYRISELDKEIKKTRSEINRFKNK